MKCLYCKKVVFGIQGVTVERAGSAHQSCHDINLRIERTYKNLKLSKLSEVELNELKDLTLEEINSRKLDDYNEVESF